MLLKKMYDYDPKFDVMYITFSDNNNSYGDDEIPGIIFLRDIYTDELTGYTITHFKKMYNSGNLPKLPPSFPYSYDDLYQKIKT